jgi:tetratricopeptide (TPR) repeat protein
MNIATRCARSIALALLLAAVAKPLVAQSPNPQALSWFGLGLKEKDAKKKIAFYSKAVEVDPAFVEAHYNLGLAYKQEQNYALAEQSLVRALSAKAGKLENETKLKILYELGMTYKKLGKLKECEEALRGAKGLAGRQAVQDNIALELGRILSQQDRYEEALSELNERKKTSPARADEFSALITSMEETIALQKLYDSAEKARTAGNLQQAKSLFEQILAKYSGFKDVQGKLAQVDSLLKDATKTQSFAALYDQAQRYAADGNLVMAISTYENLLQQAGSYKDAGAKLQKAREQAEQKQLGDRLEADYAAGLAQLKSQDWTRAVVSFEKVLAQNRDFRDVRRRLAEAQRGLERESTENVLARFYADGVSAMNRKDMAKALAAFEKVAKLNSSYRDVANLRAQVEIMLEQQTSGLADTTFSTEADLDSLYQEALAVHTRGDYVQAVAAYEKIQAAQANYRDVAERLAQARLNLNLQEAAPAGGSSGSLLESLYLPGAIAVCIVVPLFGFVMCSPIVKARFYLLKGDYSTAAQIYEKVLARNPQRVRLYPALANLYLLMGRHDEHALKVYKTILQLNLTTNNRDEITATVGQHYLSEGRTDSDALDVLENLLKTEHRKLEHNTNA